MRKYGCNRAAEMCSGWINLEDLQRGDLRSNVGQLTSSARVAVCDC